MVQLKVALIGFGTAGSVFHAPLIQADPGLALESVVTGNAKRAQECGEKYPHARVFGGVGELFADSTPDLVVIATPHATHIPLAEEAIAHGCAVVIDKPVGLDMDTVRSFAINVDAQAARVSVFQNRRWDGDFLTARQLIKEGLLGKVHRFESRFERWRPQPRPGSWRETNTHEEGGGALMDLGPHLVDQALELFGPAETVYAELDTRREALGAEDDVFLAIRHVGGVTSHLWMSALAAQPGPRMRVLGSAGAYVKHGMEVQEMQLRGGITPEDSRYGCRRRRHGAVSGTALTKYPIRRSSGHGTPTTPRSEPHS